MKEKVLNALAIVFAAMVFVGIVAGMLRNEIEMWRECLDDHSFWYCERVLTK